MQFKLRLLPQLVAFVGMILFSVGCYTYRQGTVKYIELDPEIKEYPSERPDAYKHENCGLTLLDYGALMNKLQGTETGARGIKNFEVYTATCLNIRGEVVK